MHFTRRQFVVLAGALSISPLQRVQADEHNTLFWHAGRADQSSAIFGYERINAALVSDIVSDGDRIADSATSIYTDFNQNLPLARYKVNLKDVPPVFPELQQADADDLRRIMTAGGGAAVENLPGFVVSLFLIGEGQHPAGPTAGGVIIDHVRSSGKQPSPLISDAEFESIWSPPDTPAARSVGARQISYLLQKRRQVGPIGLYLETLYAQRRSSEIMQLIAEIDREGVISPTVSLGGPQFKALLLEQILKIRSAKNFIFLPLGVLLGDDGILQRMRGNGFQINSLA
ncbi:hypothetical protein [Rhizobium sp. ZPR3]|uniref:TraB/GumN family protein n=2 Tax=unclassified Rhizobium TaxID=2613769 RepID=A0AAU7SQM2_9HYPH